MKWLGRLLIVLGVVVALVIGVEFVVRSMVQSQVETSLASADVKLEQPTVTLAGGSVLAAAAQGRFVDVSGTAVSAEVPFEGKTVPVRQITYQAHDIRLVSTTEAVIGTLDLTGTLDYAGLSELAGQTITNGGDGRVLVSYQVDILGLNQLTIGVSAVPVLDVPSQQVDLEQARIDVGGVSLTEAISQQIIDRVVKPISVAAQDNVTMNAITVTDVGLTAALTAKDVPVKRA